MTYSNNNPRIRFKGKEYLFIGDEERTDGAIATEEQYANFETSFAHLEDDKVMRFQEVIGTKNDIEWLD